MAPGSAAAPDAPARRPRIEPLAAARYKVQFTASEQLVGKLRQAQELLRRQVPDGDPAKLVPATATLAGLVGVMLLVARLMRLGFVANFISTPVLTGFKAGIGLVIVLDQAPKLLGIHIAKQGFLLDIVSLVRHVPATSWITLAVAAATFAALFVMERLWAHSPAPLVAVGGAIAASWWRSAISTSGPGLATSRS